MSGSYLRGREGGRGGEKTEEHLQRSTGRPEVEKKQAVKTFLVNDLQELIHTRFNQPFGNEQSLNVIKTKLAKIVTLNAPSRFPKKEQKAAKVDVFPVQMFYTGSAFNTVVQSIYIKAQPLNQKSSMLSF